MRNIFSLANLEAYNRFLEIDNYQSDFWLSLFETVPNLNSNLVAEFQLAGSPNSYIDIFNHIKLEAEKCSNVNDLIELTMRIMHKSIPETPQNSSIKNLLYYCGAPNSSQQAKPSRLFSYLASRDIRSLAELRSGNLTDHSDVNDQMNPAGFYVALTAYLKVIAYYTSTLKHDEGGIKTNRALEYLGYDKESAKKMAGNLASKVNLRKKNTADNSSYNIWTDWLNPFLPTKDVSGTLISHLDIFPYALSIDSIIQSKDEPHKDLFKSISRAIIRLGDLKPNDRIVAEYIIERITNINLINCESNIIREINSIEEYKALINNLQNMLCEHSKLLDSLWQKQAVISSTIQEKSDTPSDLTDILRNATRLLHDYQSSIENCSDRIKTIFQNMERNVDITDDYTQVQEAINKLSPQKEAATAPIRRLCRDLGITLPEDTVIGPEPKPIYTKLSSLKLPFALLSLYPLPRYRLSILKLLDKTYLTEFIDDGFMNNPIKVTEVIKQLLIKEKNDLVTCADLQSIIDEYEIPTDHKQHTVKTDDITEFLLYQICIYFPLLNKIFLSLLAMLPKGNFNEEFCSKCINNNHTSLFKDKENIYNTSNRLAYGSFEPVEQYEEPISKEIIDEHITSFWSSTSKWSLHDDDTFSIYLDKIVKPYMTGTLPFLSNTLIDTTEKPLTKYIRFAF